jgi:hypothetical protein
MPLTTHYLPELEDTERVYIQDLISEMSHQQAQLFATAYRGKRKDPHTVLLTAIVGLVAIPRTPALLAWSNRNGLYLLVHLGAFVSWFNLRSGSIQRVSLRIQSKGGPANRC